MSFILKNFKGLNRCSELDIAFNRFYDLYYIVAAGNLNLVDADNKNLKLEDIKTNDEELVRLFLRSERLKSCMISYNCVEDYIMQILAVCLNLKIKVKNKKDKYKYNYKRNYIDLNVRDKDMFIFYIKNIRYDDIKKELQKKKKALRKNKYKNELEKEYK